MEKTTRIQPLDVPAGVGPDTVASEKLLDELRSLVGKILFVATSTRPDLVGSLGVLASAANDLRGRHVLDINRLVSQIHAIPYPRLLVRSDLALEKLHMVAFVDGSEGPALESRPRQGYAVALSDGFPGGAHSIINWGGPRGSPRYSLLHGCGGACDGGWRPRCPPVACVDP